MALGALESMGRAALERSYREVVRGLDERTRILVVAEEDQEVLGMAHLVFSGATTRWLGFADGCGLLGLAIAGLVLHELSTERVVHSLEVIDARASGTSVEAEREPVHA